MSEINKTQIAKEIHTDVELSVAKTEQVINATFDNINGHMAAGETVAIAGFGKFSVKERAARTGRNPQTGAEIQIAAARVPVFKAGKGLKDAVKG